MSWHTASELRATLARFEVRAMPTAGRRHAAVAVAVTEAGHGAQVPGMPEQSAWSDAPALLLTRRASDLRAHAGQWAMPGGRIDDGESPEQAALRELREEVGLALTPDALLGRLDDYATRSGYVITPVVVWAGAARDVVPNAGAMVPDRSRMIPNVGAMTPDFGKMIPNAAQFIPSPGKMRLPAVPTSRRYVQSGG